MDPIKEAFQKAKQDISLIKFEIEELKSQILQIKSILQERSQQNIQQISNHDSTHTQHNILNELYNMPLEGLKESNSSFSTGNKGVPTNRQTNQQTDRQTLSMEKSPLKETLDTLNNLKNELKDNFSSLTKQELIVYGTIYQLEEQKFIVDYSILAKRLNLSESSIRDYVLRIIRKRIPLKKIKENNKKIFLSIPIEIKKIISLSSLFSIQNRLTEYSQ